MVNLTLCRLYPTAPIHLGERGIGMEEASEIIHSDSLFGALSCAWSALHGDDELEALIEEFVKGEAPFIISSGFPFISNVLLFPKPLAALTEIIGASGAKDEKKIKRAEFVSKDVFEWILSGKKPTDSDWAFIHNGNNIAGIVSASEMALIGQKPSKTFFWKRQEAPHVVLDRDDQSSSIFRVGDISFSKGTGFHFLVDFRDNSIISKFDGAMRLLGDEGIGGERSSGKGSFIFKREPVEIKTENSDNNNSSGSSLALLSLYHPAKTEVELGLLMRSRYQLITRRGWISSLGSRTLRKKTVRMISEGSIIPKMGSLPRGALVDVTPQEMKAHKVYANGLALGVPMKVRS
jgi:CRISPR-associated protein Csm4